MTSQDKQERGKCPICNKEERDYGVLELVDDQIFYPWKCLSCGATGQEWYQMEFSGHEQIKSSDHN